MHEAITARSNPSQEKEPLTQKLSPFAVYFDGKISELNRRNRRIAEKQISDILFDLEMAEDTSMGEGYSQRNQFYATEPRMSYVPATNKPFMSTPVSYTHLPSPRDS